MARNESFTCDVCGKLKGEGNKWLMYEKPMGRAVFLVAKWGQFNPALPNIGHLCSEACASTLMARTVRGEKPISELETEQKG